MKKSVVCVVGTRPEVIKMAPVIRLLREEPSLRCRVLATAQHRGMMDQMLAFFGIQVDADLDIMVPDQRLPELTARLITGISDDLVRSRPDLVLAQGDTTTVLATALASFYAQIPFGHVEAGLRTHRLDSPFPEEANRLLAGQLASLHFAPTSEARDNLIREGRPIESIFVTGNPVIDALLLAVQDTSGFGVELPPGHRLILVTTHRREGLGPPLVSICRAVRRLVDVFQDVEVLWPLHPNPSIGPTVTAALSGLDRIHIVAPLAYGPFANALSRSALVLTDSGGVQEEAPALRKPVLVLREVTERPEGVEAGGARVVGFDEERIFEAAAALLSDDRAMERARPNGSPYGDGMAANRIVRAIRNHFGLQPKATQASLVADGHEPVP